MREKQVFLYIYYNMYVYKLAEDRSYIRVLRNRILHKQ